MNKKEQTFDLNIMTINVQEVAAELAEKAVTDELLRDEFHNEEDIWRVNVDTLVYTDKAQEVFNRWYDYYYTEISKHKL